jgi:hypothetical protein
VIAHPGAVALARSGRAAAWSRPAARREPAARSEHVTELLARRPNTVPLRIGARSASRSRSVYDIFERGRVSSAWRYARSRDRNVLAYAGDASACRRARSIRPSL